jgi:hypothetical protein
MLDWLAGIGAAGAAELAGAAAVTEAGALARLRVMARDGLVEQKRLLAGEPALWLITRRGLREAGRTELDVQRVSSAGFSHLGACARVARALETALEGRFTVHSERELRAWERGGRLLASAELGYGRAPERHRPDLVCVALERRALPIAVEVELTVKAPERLAAIVRGWARSRRVAGVVYYATPAVVRALGRAIDAEQAAPAVAVLDLACAGQVPQEFLGPRRSTSPNPRAP